jgi:hypothetical protein
MRPLHRIVLWLGALALTAGPARTAEAAPAAEGVNEQKLYAVIAGYLAAFPNYVRWPDDAMAPGEPLRIGVLGRDPFGAVLDQAMAGKTAGGRKLAVMRGREPAELAQCQIVFADHPRPEVMAAFAAARSVLTIVFAIEAPAPDAMIGLVLTKDGNVRYTLNIARLRGAGLLPSAGLLRSAFAPAPKP